MSIAFPHLAKLEILPIHKYWARLLDPISIMHYLQSCLTLQYCLATNKKGQMSRTQRLVKKTTTNSAKAKCEYGGAVIEENFQSLH